MDDAVRFRCGVDTGGTFTDCVALGDDGSAVTAKVLSTPPGFVDGFIGGLARLAAELGISLSEFLRRTDRLVHGTTVATNVLVERRGATVGLIATRGHKDALFVMRGVGRALGLRPEDALNGARARKPRPLVLREHAVEVDERVNANGKVVVELNEDNAREAIRTLRDAGVDTIAVTLLWGFRNPRHERRLAELVREEAPAIPVSLASELAPRTGEYERTVATVLDAYVKPATIRYLTEIVRVCRESGYERDLLIVQCDGTIGTVQAIVKTPILTLHSGPAAGLEAARLMGASQGHRRIVVFDMGGTTSDIGLVVDGAARRRTTSVYDQYEFFVPSVEISSTGIGGGSIAARSALDGALRVGPRSAGADPGPACYGRGGREATVTDADLTLGRLDARSTLGNEMPIQADRAGEVVDRLAEELDLDAASTAAGISRLAELQVAQEIRKLTISRGYDPRDFVLYAYGGAGPLHAAAVAAELGITTIVVPQAKAASVWSAVGAARSTIGCTQERSVGLIEPFDAESIDELVRTVGEEARQRLAVGLDVRDARLRFEAGLRYRAQVHEVWVSCPPRPVTAADVESMVVAFEDEYENLFGRGTGYRAAGIELAALRCMITEPQPIGRATEAVFSQSAAFMTTGERMVHWASTGVEQTKICSGTPPLGTTVAGPAVLELEDTSILVPRGAAARVDSAGNLIVTLPAVAKNSRSVGVGVQV